MKCFFKAFILLAAFVTVSSGNLFAQQSYKTGLGLRGGYPSGITVNHFIAKSTAIEGVVSFGWGGFGVTGLYKIYNTIPDLGGTKWYYGFGAHLATANASKKNPWSSDPGGKMFIGADGIIGAEYVFADAPISLSLDVLPILNIIEDTYLWFNAGISIRYTFK
jgi:hypothetical protein